MRKFWMRWGSGGNRQAGRDTRHVLPRAGGREIRIGLDLGTATTSCVVNLLGRAPAEDECLALALQGGEASMPTTIAVEGDIMRVGAAAEQAAHPLRSVLMWLPMLAGEAVDTSVSHKYGDLRQTVFKFGDHMISAKEVVILYLERVLGRVIAGLDLHLGAGKWHGALRVAAPSAAGRRYREMLEEIVSLALDLALAAGGREPSMTESLSGLTERYQRGNGRSQHEQCTVAVVSSAEAIAASLGSDHQDDASRRIVAVDIGAGTTSAICFQQQGDTVTLRGVSGVYSGMDDIDQLFASGRAVRAQHPRVFRASSEIRASDRALVRRGLDLILAPLRDALGKATDGGRRIESWCDGRRAAFDLVLLGGGSCCGLVRSEFKRRGRTPLPGAVDFWDVRCARAEHTAEALACSGHMPRGCQAIDEAQRPLLVLAQGLAMRSITLINGCRPRGARSDRGAQATPPPGGVSAAQRARDARFDVH